MSQTLPPFDGSLVAVAAAAPEEGGACDWEAARGGEEEPEPCLAASCCCCCVLSVDDADDDDLFVSSFVSEAFCKSTVVNNIPHGSLTSDCPTKNKLQLACREISSVTKQGEIS